MKATIKIEKLGRNGSSMIISAECATIEELQDITKTCREYAPRRKLFGIL